MAHSFQRLCCLLYNNPKSLEVEDAKNMNYYNVNKAQLLQTNVSRCATWRCVVNNDGECSMW